MLNCGPSGEYWGCQGPRTQTMPSPGAAGQAGKRVGVARFFLICGEGMGVSRAGGLAEVAPPGGVECRGHTQYPAFAPNILLLLQALQKCQLGFWSLCIFCPEFAPAVHAPRRVFIESRIETIKPCQGTCSFPVYLLPWWRALLAPSLLAM